MKKLSLICAALLLSACGGEDYKAQPMLPAPPAPVVPTPPVVVTPPTPPAPMVDAYFTTVATAYWLVDMT